MAEDQTRIWVGAFGKHPGWDDHLADQGLETDLLVRVKRLMYVEGIGGNLDAGAWDALSEDERRPGFDHLFLWRWAEGLVVGRMWSSSDGKGRTRYPMIVCAHARGLAADWVLGPCLDRLERLGQECRAATDAAGVIMACDRARNELRQVSNQAPKAGGGTRSGPAAISDLASCPAMGTNAEGLVRVAYQLEREFSAFLKNDEDTGQKSRTVDVRPRHMRVPACGGSPPQAASRWMRHMLHRIDPTAPMLTMVPMSCEWVDLVVGEAASGQFLCLQASTRRIPLTTDIPYTIEDPFRSKVSEAIEAGRRGVVVDMDPGEVIEIASSARRAVGQGVKRVKAQASASKPPVALLAGGAVAIVVIIAIIAIISGGKNKKPATPSPAPSPAAPTPAAPTSASPAQIEQFRAWCIAYDQWLRVVASDLQRRPESLRIDDHIDRTLDPLRQASAAGLRLNPRDVLSNPPPTVAALAENVPAEIAQPEILIQTERIAALIRDVESGLAAWPVRTEVERMRAAFAERGWESPAQALQTALDAATPKAADKLGEALLALRRVRDVAAPLAASVDQIERIAQRMSTSGDDVLKRGADSMRSTIASVGQVSTLEELSARTSTLSDLLDVGTRIERTLDTTWEQVDREAFFANSRAHAAAQSDVGLEGLRLWAAEVSQDAYRALNPQDDPRLGMQAQSEIDEALQVLNQLASKGGNEIEPELAPLREQATALTQRVAALGGLRWGRLAQAEIERTVDTLQRDTRSLVVSVGQLQSTYQTDVAEFINTQRGVASVSSDGLDAIDVIWREGRDAIIARFEQDDNALSLRRDLDALRAALGLVEQATRVDIKTDVLPQDWQLAELRTLERAARNTAVGHVAESWKQGTVTAVEQADAQARQRMQAWQASTEAHLAAAARISVRVREMYTFDEALPDGSTLRAALAELRGSDTQDQWIAIAPRLAQSLEMLAQVDAVAQDRAALIESAHRPDLSASAQRAVWRALVKVSPAWPQDVNELERAIELRGQILTEASGIIDEDRRGAVVAELQSSLAAAWVRAFSRSTSWDNAEDILALRERCGGSLADLSASARYRVFVLSMRASLAPSDDDAAVRDKVRAELARLNLGGGAGAPAADAMLAEVLAIVNEPPDEVPPLDPAEVGPARAGWAVDPASTIDTLIYTSGTGPSAARLEFRLVTDDAGQTAYVGTHEVSIAVLAALIASDPGAADELAPVLSRSSGNAMTGWRWIVSGSDRKVVRADAWIPAGSSAPAGYFSGSVGTSTPNSEHPVQRLSASVAAFVAARLGCRLPTLTEWKAAYAMVGSIPIDAGWNVRDGSLLAARDEVARKRGETGTGWAGAALPDLGVQPEWLGAEAHPFSDGHVWPIEVTAGPDVPFKNIVGNVGEFVLIDLQGQADRIEQAGSVPTDEKLSSWTSTMRDIQVGAVGASLFSKPDHPVDEPVVIDVRKDSTDVGFRLAFSPQAGRVKRPIAQRIQPLLTSAPFDSEN